MSEVERMFERQVQRAADASAWLQHLDLGPGDRCLDVGSGPGYFSLLLAERVGPSGRIYAIDASQPALAHLERLRASRSIANIVCIHGDAATADLPDGPADAALVAMMLHHTPDPAAVLRNVARLLRPDGRAVIAEFHPEGTGEHGVALARRIAPDTVRPWCEMADLGVVSYERPTTEHYVMVCRRG
jgi:ubiquinone/menaquinone biosynthesis C-methylase UbiE